MITEQRKLYLKNWRKNNRQHILDYHRKWSSIKNKSELNGEYYGSCGIGRKYELIAQSILSGSIPSPSFSYPSDLLWNGFKIDVKMRNKNKKGYFHFTTRPTCDADYYFCFCVEISIKYILLIPSIIYKSGIDISEKNINTKYKQYLFTVKEQ